MLKFILFFLFVCFLVWGFLFASKELARDPEHAIKVLKYIAIAIVVGIIASAIITVFVVLF